MDGPSSRSHDARGARPRSLRARRRLFLSGSMLAGAVAFGTFATLPAMAAGGSGGGAVGGLGAADHRCPSADRRP